MVARIVLVVIKIYFFSQEFNLPPQPTPQLPTNLVNLLDFHYCDRMSPLLIILTFLGITAMFSQLGGKVAARSAPAWILLFGFLLFCAITPNSLKPIAEALGIQVVSNLIFAALIFFLIFQAIQESVFSTQFGRKLRQLVSTQAAQSFTFPKTNRTLVVLPTYNEEKNVELMVRQLRAVGGFDFCFINDGSVDSTEPLLRSLNAPFVTHSANIGVSGGLMTGFKIALLHGYDHVVQCDSDGQHPVEKIKSLVEQAEGENADLVIASRFTGGTKDESSTVLRRFGSLMIRYSLRLFSSSQTMTDPTSGFRIYSRSVIPLLVRDMPEEYPEPEILALLLLHGKKICEVPVIMSPRHEGKSSISGFRSAHFMMKVLSALIGLRLRNL
jgi:hypothetical protein